MAGQLQEGLLIVAVGISGVFVVLLILMLAISILGRLFGKKPPPPKKDAPRKPKPPATNDSPPAPEAAS